MQLLLRFASALSCVLPFAIALAAPPGPTPQAPAARWVIAPDRITDTRTALIWSAADNGADIDWNGARGFCDARGAGWRLPSVDELRSLYADPADTDAHLSCGAAQCRSGAPLRLSGAWFWSAAAVGKDAYDGDELAWGVSLASGGRTQSVKDQSYGSRALCVRDGTAH